MDSTERKEERTIIDPKEKISRESHTSIVRSCEYCYLLTEGAENQDTTIIQLVVKDTIVKGVMNWLPAEKDSRKGILKGDISGDEIKAVWHFVQEGKEDSLRLAFKLAPQQLLQKPLKVNVAIGTQETDHMAGYVLEYTQHDCSKK